MAGKSGYRIFNVELAHKTQISPSMLRLVFRGGDIANMKCDSPDQRIKLLFDSLDGTPSALSNDGDWYATWLAMPKEQRPTMRTYTLRAVDSQQQEMAVEFVAHGTEGPASAWAINSAPGDRLQMIAPDREVVEDSGGYEWLPPKGLKRALLVADETALPAVRGILELIAHQPEPPQVQVFIEVPETADCVDLSAFDFAQVHWLPRDKSAAHYGEALLAGVKQHVWLPEVQQQHNLQEEGEGELLWDKATSNSLDFYGWVAAESTAVKLLRRYLIGERGVEQQKVNFMAYWAKGRVK